MQETSKAKTSTQMNNMGNKFALSPQRPDHTHSRQDYNNEEHVKPSRSLFHPCVYDLRTHELYG